MPNERVQLRAKPRATLSLDLDNLWSYLKSHGDARWQARPTYLPDVVPVALELLEELDLKITFFMVGRDAERDENIDALRAVTAAGHEVGNHSYEHQPWLHRYTRAELEEEVEKAEQAIESAVGQRPRAFRGPGFTFSTALFEVLAHRGYRFDASTFPTVIGPLARMYHFALSRLTPAERDERRELFGSWSAGLLPNEPYEWMLPGGRRLVEIPVTVFPYLRTPFHLTYVQFLADYSESAALAYWRAALRACRAAGVAPSVLLHPLDLVGGDAVPELRFFPGMKPRSEAKRRLLIKALGILREHYDVVPMSVHAQSICSEGSLGIRHIGARAVVPFIHPSTASRS